MPRSRPGGQPAWLKPGRAGGAVLRTTNPYGNPCPACGAARYERCFKVHRSPTIKGVAVGSDFIYIKDKACSRRVPLALGIANEEDNEGEQGEMHDDYSGCDL